MRGCCSQATGGTKFHASRSEGLSAGASSNKTEEGRAACATKARNQYSAFPEQRFWSLSCGLPCRHLLDPLSRLLDPSWYVPGELQNTHAHMSGGISALCACFVFIDLPPPFSIPWTNAVVGQVGNRRHWVNKADQEWYRRRMRVAGRVENASR